MFSWFPKPQVKTRSIFVYPVPGTVFRKFTFWGPIPREWKKDKVGNLATVRLVWAHARPFEWCQSGALVVYIYLRAQLGLLQVRRLPNAAAAAFFFFSIKYLCTYRLHIYQVWYPSIEGLWYVLIDGSTGGMLVRGWYLALSFAHTRIDAVTASLFWSFFASWSVNTYCCKGFQVFSYVALVLKRWEAGEPKRRPIVDRLGVDRKVVDVIRKRVYVRVYSIGYDYQA